MTVITLWPAETAGRIAATDDFHIAPYRNDGQTTGTLTWIWSAVVDGRVFVRAWNGARSSWYQAALAQRAGKITAAGSEHDVTFTPLDDADLNDRIDAAYAAKYAGSPYLPPMLAAAPKAATVEVTPRTDANSNETRPNHLETELPMTANDFQQPFPLGETNDAFAQYFSGQSYLAPVVDGGVPIANVTFEPACRNNWHIHHGTNGGGDQVLLCTAGSGWYQADGEDPISMTPGTAIRVPAGTKHWHGAKADAWFSHLAFITPGEDVSNEWLEPVTDEVYGTLPKNGDAA